MRPRWKGSIIDLKAPTLLLLAQDTIEYIHYIPQQQHTSTMAAGPSIPHYLWAAGHALVLAMSLYSLLGVVTFKPHPYAYKLSYLGAAGGFILSSLVVLMVLYG